MTISGISGFARSFSPPHETSTTPPLTHPTSSEPTLNTVADGSRVREQASRLIQALDLPARPLSLSRDDGAGAAGAVSALLEALDLAAAQSAEEIAHLTPWEQHTVKALNDYITTGAPPDRGDFPPGFDIAQQDEWFDALSDLPPLERGGDGAGSLAGSETSGDTVLSSVIAGGDEPVRRLNRVLELLSRTLLNDFTDDHARRAANVANDVLRNAASVGVPTFIRQAVAYAIERGLSAGGATVAARTALGALAAALPLMLNAAALLRDHCAGTATMQSHVGRGLNITIGVGALALAGATGSLATMASTLAASNLVYSGLREALESALRLRDNANAPNNRSIAAATATTFFTQSVADAIMRAGASPSGQAAAAQGWPALNDLARAVINTSTQTAGDFLTYVFVERLAAPRPNESELARTEAGLSVADSASEHLRILLQAKLPSASEAANMLNKPAARGLSTNNVTVLSNVIGSEVVDKLGLSDWQATIAKAAAYGALSAMLAPLTAISDPAFSRQQHLTAYNLEAARAAPEVTGREAVRAVRDLTRLV